MIQVKNGEQVAIMRKAGRITGEALLKAAEHIKEGISTYELDKIIYEYIVKNGLFEENPIYNVNIPHESKGIRMTYEGSQYFSDEFVLTEEGEDLYRQAGEPIPDVCPEDLDRDTVAVHAGYIAITPLMATRTNMQVFEKFKTK